MNDDPIDDDELDRVDGTGFVGWLIQTGAATMVGVMPWTAYRGFSSLIDLRSRGFTEQMMSDWVVPMVISAVASGMGALIVVLAARAGRRLPLAVLLAMGAVIGTAIAWLWMGVPGVGILFGTVCGLAGAGALAFVRAKHLR